MPDLLAFSDSGNASGVPIFMIHPLGAHSFFWTDCQKGFGPGVRLIAPDLRGSGKTPQPESPLTIEQNVADIERLREHLGLDKLVLIGCAVGGLTAGLYTARYPSRVMGLIISNPIIRISKEAGTVLEMRAHAVRAGGMEALLPHAIDNAFKGYENALCRAKYEVEFIAHDPEGYALAALGVVGTDIGDELEQVRCPTLLIPGGRDALLARSHAEQIAERVPKAVIQDYPAGAHFIPYQEPELFGGMVSAFLDTHGLRS
jgi:pimeloyl-ACP methyl ester carboxylesterase